MLDAPKLSHQFTQPLAVLLRLPKQLLHFGRLLVHGRCGPGQLLDRGDGRSRLREHELGWLPATTRRPSEDRVQREHNGDQPADRAAVHHRKPPQKDRTSIPGIRGIA